MDQPKQSRTRLAKALRRKLPKFKRNLETETVEINGVPVHFWRFKRRWFWGVADSSKVRLPESGGAG